MTDTEILNRLKDIDNGDADVTEWEAKFLDTVLGQESLSPKQRKVALEMIDKYGS